MNGGLEDEGKELFLWGVLSGNTFLMRGALQRGKPSASSLMVRGAGAGCLLMSKIEVLYYSCSDGREYYHWRGQFFFLALPRSPDAPSALDIAIVQPHYGSMNWAGEMAGLPWCERGMMFPWIGWMNQFVPQLHCSDFWQKTEMPLWAAGPPPLPASFA